MTQRDFLEQERREFFRKLIIKLEGYSDEVWFSDAGLDKLIQKHKSYLNEAYRKENKNDILIGLDDL